MTINLKLKQEQFIKFDDVVEIKRKGNKQSKIVTKNFDGVTLKPGSNKFTTKKFDTFKNNAWLKVLKDRKDVIISEDK